MNILLNKQPNKAELEAKLEEEARLNALIAENLGKVKLDEQVDWS